MARSAVVVAIDLPDELEHIRAAETEDARRGVPAHVTLLYPFVPAEAIDDAVLGTVGSIAAGTPAFEVAFVDVRRFRAGPGGATGVVWLAPEPAAPFVALTDALVAAFPDHRPYGGAITEVVPHLTIATDDARQFDAVEAEACRHLPVRRRARVVTVLVEDAAGRWRELRRVPLGGAGRR